MKLNYHKSHRGGGQSQALHNVSFFNNLPEPSLWNSQIGRREFLGKVGKASVGTAIALNGLKLEVMASGSGTTPNTSSLGYSIDRFEVQTSPSGTASASIKVRAINTILSGVGATRDSTVKVTITLQNHEPLPFGQVDPDLIVMGSSSWGPDSDSIAPGQNKVVWDDADLSVSFGGDCWVVIRILAVMDNGNWAVLDTLAVECQYNH